MAYKFQLGQAILSGALDQEGDIDVKNYAGDVMAKMSDDGTISGSGDFQIKGGLVIKEVAVTSTAAELNLVDGASAGTVVNNKAVIYNAGGVVIGQSFATSDDGNVGCASNTDLLTLAAAEVTVKSNSDFTVAKVGGLKLADGAVNSTAAELNLLDGSSAGSIVNSKAVIYSGTGAVTASAFSSSGEVKFGGNLVMGPVDSPVTRISTAGDATLAGVTAVTLGHADDSDLLTLADQSITVAANAALTYKGTAITSDGAELNLVDGSSAGTIVNSKAVIYGSSGEVNATTLQIGGTSIDATAAEINAVADASAASEAAVDVAADFIMFHDGGLTGAAKFDSIADLVAGMAGGGLTADAGVLSTQAGAVSQSFDGKTLVEGYNYLTGTAGAAKLILPPNPSDGDSVIVKAAAEGTVTISASADHTIDGSTTIILESPYAAVNCVKMASGSWSIV